MGNLTAVGLRCEYRVDPIGIDIPNPRLFWTFESIGRKQFQRAYHILVASSRSTLDADEGDLWDTGEVESQKSTHVVYSGHRLTTHQKCFWKVRVWNRDGQPARWSKVATWTMGLLDKSDWQAAWIGYDAPYADVIILGHSAVMDTRAGMQRSPIARALKRGIRLLLESQRGPQWLTSLRRFLLQQARSVVGRLWLKRMMGTEPVLAACPHLRRQFFLRKPASGTLHVSALGICDIYVNGQQVGVDESFIPGWVDYGQRLYYRTYSVGHLLCEGANVIGAVLADGWYCGYVGPGRRRNHYGLVPRLAIQMHVSYPDGTDEIIVSDENWRAHTGPHLEADLLMGESYDARLEMPGWAAPGFHDSHWAPVDVGVDSGSPPRPRAMPHEPVRRSREIRPVSVTELSPGRQVFDMGENFAGWVRLRARGPAGTRIILRFAERLNPDGTLYVANLRGARATDCYVTKGEGEEVWEPRFTYHGFQYVEVTGYPGIVGKDDLVGVAICSVDMTAGALEVSHSLVNTLAANIARTQEANFVEVPTDCPQRDERLGWLGDAQIFLRTATYHADVASFISKWLRDVTDAQTPDGEFTDFAPLAAWMRAGSPAWADAGIIVPWELYQVYEDERVIESMYPSMCRFVELVHAANPEHLWVSRVGDNNGEWLEIDAYTPKDLFATAYFARSARLLGRMAAVLGRSADAERYELLFRSVREAFVAKFVARDGQIKGGTQTAYVLALHFDLIPKHLRRTVAALLVADIESRGGRLTTGFFGTGHVLPTLTKCGFSETAYRLLTREEFPSWGYSIRQGATSIWEHWDGWTERRGFQNPLMNSFSHYGLGAIGEWLFSTVAGISPAEPGYREVLICPQPGGGLTWARARYNSIRGVITTSWISDEGRFCLEVNIPTNTTATVILPVEKGSKVTEGGAPLESVPDIHVTEINGSSPTLKIGSGSYHFEVESKHFRALS